MDQRVKFALAGAVVLAGAAFARPAYRTQAIDQLHIEGSKMSVKTMSCAYCHVNAAGGAPWNSFGEALKAGFREEPKFRFDEVLYAVLKANEDGDGDGYADVLEVYANTLPGDKASKPTKSVADLQKALDADGGVEKYKSERMKR